MSTTFAVPIALVYFTGGTFIFLLGLTILRTGPGSTPTRAAALMLFFAGVGPILTATGIMLQATLRENAVVFNPMVESFEYLWEFYFPSLLLFSLTFPRENRLFQKASFVGFLLFAPHLFHLVTIMEGNEISKAFTDLTKHLSLGKSVSLGEGKISFSGPANVVSAMIDALVKLHRHLFSLVNLLYAGVAFLLLSKNTRRLINPRVTGQLKTLLVGLGVSIFAYALAKITPWVLHVEPSEDLSLALINISLFAGGGSIAYAVVKQQFLGIKYVLRKSVLYGAAALMFAVLYLTVVRPVSDFFGRYSMASKEVIETGFIILTIIAFQPVLFRVEELLEKILLKGREDLQRQSKELGEAITYVTSFDELEQLLRAGFRDILDASAVNLHLEDARGRGDRLLEILAEIGGPVTRSEFTKVGEKYRGQIGNGPPLPDTRGMDAGEERGPAGHSILPTGAEVVVPILKEHRCVGFMTLGEKTYGLRYGTEELAFLSVIANQISVALDNIRLLRENVEKKVLEEELRIARRIQSQLLPQRTLPLSGYDLYASTLPSRQVGGDYYDFRLLGEDNVALVVADVSGKGIPASLLMATLRAAVNSNEDASRSPGDMLRRVNTLLHSSTSPEEFATVFYGVLDLRRGVLKYANAGHEFPFLVDEQGIRRLSQSGIVLGCLEDFAYEEHECVIPEDGYLVLYTDGVTDAKARGGELFGDSRLSQVLESLRVGDSKTLCEKILGAVQDFAEDGEYQDDLTLLVLRRHRSARQDYANSRH